MKKSYIDVCRDSSKEEVVGLPTCAWDADFSFIPKYKYSKEGDVKSRKNKSNFLVVGQFFKEV